MNPSFLKFAEMLVEYELILEDLEKPTYVDIWSYIDPILFCLSRGHWNKDALIITQTMNLQWLPLFPGWRSGRVSYVILGIHYNNKQVHLKDIVRFTVWNTGEFFDLLIRAQNCNAHVASTLKAKHVVWPHQKPNEHYYWDFCIIYLV